MDGTARNGAAKLGMADSLVAMGLLAASILLRLSTLGDISAYLDDTFYFLVGQEMHAGALPYVDIWDRKPPGLFLIYYLIAGLSREVWAYQFTAWCSAAATGWVIHRLALGWTTRAAAIMAGLAYLVLTCVFNGANGQAPMFYNLFVAISALMVWRDGEAQGRGACTWRTWLATALMGLAITIKQTVLFEGVFLGLWSLWAMWRGGAGPRALALAALGLAALGMLPMAAFGAFYAALGHWHEFWHAMVTANLAKRPMPVDVTVHHALGILLRGLPALAIAIGLLARFPGERQERRFLAAWMVAALAGFLSVPNFFIHYALPLMVPLSVLLAFAFAGARYGRVLFVLVLVASLLWFSPFDFAGRQRSIAATDRLAQLVRDHDSGSGLLVFEGPVYLYALTGKSMLSPLVFPHHLNHAIERDVSHLGTSGEIDRILTQRPGAVVISLGPRNLPANEDSWAKVRHYVESECRKAGTVTIYEQGVSSDLVVWGDCARG